MSPRTAVILAIAVAVVIVAAAIWATAASGPCLRGEHMAGHACERDR